jgi:hypothetical protein
MHFDIIGFTEYDMYIVKYLNYILIVIIIFVIIYKSNANVIITNISRNEKCIIPIFCMFFMYI